VNIYILRHGIAVERGAKGCKHDAERPLTAEGRQKLLHVATALQTLGISFDVILSSPYLRARQTAELIAGKLDCARKIKFTEHLEPVGNFRSLLQAIGQLEPMPASLLLVGHEPALSLGASLLVSGSTKTRFELKKAGLIALDAGSLVAGGAVLQFMLTPRQMRLIAAGAPAG
jgi:phosphohistidine phosphatase